MIPGGSSMPVLPAKRDDGIDHGLRRDPEAGSGLGSGAVIVMDETTCMVRACRIIARSTAESCGQCTPCREGTGWMHPHARRICGVRGLDDLQMPAPPGQIESTPSARSAKPQPGRCRLSCPFLARNSMLDDAASFGVFFASSSTTSAPSTPVKTVAA